MQKLFKETLHIIEQSSFLGLIRGGIITEKDKNSMAIETPNEGAPCD
jgi:hypothetical protein